ncbi:polysaccharide pyruvyl transferase family protein [Nostoc sp.]|uniref:polysaccharide pyruvyl transferase family protein n=1 Tax=Nostoc sp. TaxID=1180 RepID=UPI002FFBEE13
MKTLVAGWFSFEEGHATAGDLLAAELACDWLESAGISYDIAVDPPFTGGINWRLTDPKNYSQIVFVCGPFLAKGTLETEFLTHFAGCRLIGLDLTMLESLDKSNPFDVLLERDSSVRVNPDITFISPRKLVPVVGVCLVEPYEQGLTDITNTAIHRFLASREVAVVKIDTRLDTNTTGLRTPAEVESLLARMDLVITTRLHGTVLSLKNGVPTISIDPEAGGAKIKRQAEKIGWSVMFTVDELTDEKLQKAFDYCLTQEARTKAKECCDRSQKMLEEVRDEFIRASVDSGDSEVELVRIDSENYKYENFRRIEIDSNYQIYSGDLYKKGLKKNVKQLFKSIRRMV